MRNLMKVVAFLFIAGIFLIAPMSTQAKDLIVGKYNSFFSEFDGCTYVTINLKVSGSLLSPNGDLETLNCINVDESIVTQSFISLAQNQQCAIGNLPPIPDEEDGVRLYFSCIAWSDTVSKMYKFLSFPLTFQPPPEPAN